MAQGHCHPDFQPVADALDRQLARWQGGAAICVYHRGEPVVDLWGGVRNREGEPWERDTLAPSFSTTKGIASTLLHVMVSRGLLDHDDPVSRHWPEFAQGGKRDITVRQVMCHRAGLFDARSMIDHADRLLDWEYMADALARAEPAHRPDARSCYHGLTYGFLVGEIVRRVSGKPFPQALRDEIARPLGLDGLYCGAPEEAIARAARLFWPESLRRAIDLDGPGFGKIKHKVLLIQGMLRLIGVPVDVGRVYGALYPVGMAGFEFDAPETLRHPIPAANGLFSARSLARLYAALAAGGELDGVRLLSAETIDRANRVQRGGIDGVVPFPMGWKLGYHRVVTTRGIPRRAFGHFGLGGSGAWCCPDRNLAMGFTVNAGMGTPFGDLRTFSMSGTVLQCANRRRRADVSSAGRR